MLTFEDFFLKKKIDLPKLQVEEPVLFAQFSRHYPLMGEKSFDHTKKYHFNQLRRAYPLAQIEPHAVQTDAITAMAVQAVAVAAAQNINASLTQPKFREDNLPELVDDQVDTQDVSLMQEEKLITDAEDLTIKPAFKPRFNPKNLPKTTVEVTEFESNEVKAEPVKPIFKPKFNMQNIKKDAVKTASDINVPMQEPVVENDATNDVSLQNLEQIKAKAAFKPRFNQKNIPKQIIEDKIKVTAENNEPIAPAFSQPAENHSIKTASEHDSTNTKPSLDAAEQKVEKAVFKPRFQMKNIKKPE